MNTTTNALDSTSVEEETQGEATLLVSEFPPPPFYYKQASKLTPPEIPRQALIRGTEKAESAARVRSEAERLRQVNEGDLGDVLAGKCASELDEDEGDVIAVFGEIVEDPMVFVTKPVEDPKIIRDEVKRLNREVVQGFVELVHDLVNRPADNKKQRDELNHNILLMLQETNKFREHQCRELLIEILERQLEEREKFTVELEDKIALADALLEDIPV